MNLIPKTDKEIRDMAMGDWVAVLIQLWEAVGKPVDNKQLAVYVKQLGDIPLGILEKVVSEMIRSNTWNSVPSIGAIWQEVRKDGWGTEDLKAWQPVIAKDRIKTGHAHGELDYAKAWSK